LFSKLCRLAALLLLVVVLLMAGSIKGVPISPGYGEYKKTAAKEYSTTPPPY
jgi:hypothetical protein